VRQVAAKRGEFARVKQASVSPTGQMLTSSLGDEQLTWPCCRVLASLQARAHTPSLRLSTMSLELESLSESLLFCAAVRDSKEGLAWDGGFDHYLIKKEVQSAPEIKPREVSVSEDGLSELDRMRTGRIYCQLEVVDTWVECPFAEPAWLAVGILHRVSN
jgi:hypothetical protein